MADEEYLLASIEQLQERLDWVLESGEQGVALGALHSLSDDARYLGSESWRADTVPRQVRNLVLAATARFIRNPDGYETSRAGDETLGWGDRRGDAGIATFTADEKDRLRSHGGKSKLWSVEVVAWGRQPYSAEPRKVPILNGGKPMPLDYPDKGDIW